MGSDSCPPEEQPLHAVTVPEFYLGTYPVTRKQWRDVSALPRINRDMAPLFYSDSVDHETHDMLPVDFVRLTDIDEFFARLKIETGRPYRMPSEAEWEYACRAGTSTVYHFGDAISLAVVNYNALQRPLGLTPVGSKKAPNRFGLHDMHGNVLERTADQARDSYVGAPTDGSPWLAGPDPAARIARGGMFLWGAERARSSTRTVWYANAAASGVGFRLALSACPAAESGSTA